MSKNSTQITNKIIELYKTKYYDTSFKYFHELLSSGENINVSYSFVFKTLTNSHILSLKPTRAKRKIDNGSCINYNNEYYYPVEEEKTVTFKAKTQVTLIDSPLTNNKFIEFNGKVYKAVRLHKNKVISKTLESDIQLEKVGTFPVDNEPPLQKVFISKNGN